MTKRQHYTLEEVMDHLSDEEDDYDDPDEPMMEGSDDEFSDLEMDERDDGDMYDPVDTPAALPGTSTLTSGQPCSLTHSSTLSAPRSPPQSPPPTDTPSSTSSSQGKYLDTFTQHSTLDQSTTTLV